MAFLLVVCAELEKNEMKYDGLFSLLFQYTSSTLYALFFKSCAWSEIEQTDESN